jgi:hypothetical protein
MRLNKLNRHLSRTDNSRVLPSHAVGYDQQITQSNADMEEGIMVDLAQGASVALFSEEDDWLPKDRCIAHT